MTNQKKTAPGGDRRGLGNTTDNTCDYTETASFIGTSPHTSKHRQKLNRRALADVAERPLAVALLSALQNKGAA